MNYLGCHLSATGGYTKMVKTAMSIGADTFAFFTRNPGAAGQSRRILRMRQKP